MNKTEQLIIRNIAILNVITVLMAVFLSYFIYLKTHYSLVFCFLLLGINLGIVYILNKQIYTIVVVQTVLGRNGDGEGLGDKIDRYFKKFKEVENEEAP